jgi:hypothetical protein
MLNKNYLWECPDVELTRKYLKLTILNMFKELRESMRLMSGPIRGNGRWEKDQRIIFKLKL